MLAKHLEAGEKDIYFVDDTHWSPYGAKIVAEEILKELNNKLKISNNLDR